MLAVRTAIRLGNDFIVFDSLDALAARIDAPDLDVSADDQAAYEAARSADGSSRTLEQQGCSRPVPH